MRSNNYSAVIVGGGFYGARLALALRARGGRVLLVEREAHLLGRASLRNQARVHNGYHYPRSILTSLRSRLNYARFLDEYEDCVFDAFTHYYAIARGTSKVTATQFAEFCRRIGAPLSDAPKEVRALFDANRIESVFEVRECAFDAVKLRARMTRELDAAGVEVMTSTEAVRMRTFGETTRVTLSRIDDALSVDADLVLNCTYSRLNHLLELSGAATIPAKHELTEMALIEPPQELNGAAVTVMDGPFFSMMPYPSSGGLFTLSHVRYTPHCSWFDRAGENVSNPGNPTHWRDTRFLYMVRDAERYLPAMRSARYADSLWEVKTLMPRSEQDDSRPILLRRSEEHPGCLTVLGAKIDSVYDVEEALAALLAREPALETAVA